MKYTKHPEPPCHVLPQATPQAPKSARSASPEVKATDRRPPMERTPSKPARKPRVKPQGRPRFKDPTDPAQIHAITRRCKQHYIKAFGNQWVKIPRVEAIRMLKAMPPMEKIPAFTEADTVWFFNPCE